MILGRNLLSIGEDEEGESGMKIFALLLSVGISAGALYGWIHAHMETKKYESTMVVALMLDGESAALAHEERFANELVFLTSSETFRWLAADLDGAGESVLLWNDPEEFWLEEMEGAFEIRRLEGTSLIEIKAVDVDREHAFDLVKGLPEAYRRRKKQIRQMEFSENMDVLKARLRNREDERIAAFKKLEQKSKELEIPYFQDEDLMKQVHQKLVAGTSGEEVAVFADKMAVFDSSVASYEESLEREGELESLVNEKILRLFRVPESLEIYDYPDLATRTKEIERIGQADLDELCLGSVLGRSWGGFFCGV